MGADPRFATRLLRIEHYEALGAELDARFRGRPTEHWVARLALHDVPFAPIHSVDAAVADPQARHLGLIVPVDAPQTARHAVRPAVQFDGQRAASVRAAPLLGEQTARIRDAVSGSHSWPAA